MRTFVGFIAAAFTLSGCDSGPNISPSNEQETASVLAETNIDEISEDKIKQDLIGKNLGLYLTFHSMSEFESFSVVEQNNYGELIEIKAEAIVQSNQDGKRRLGVMQINYRKKNGEWVFSGLSGDSQRLN